MFTSMVVLFEVTTEEVIRAYFAMPALQVSEVDQCACYTPPAGLCIVWLKCNSVPRHYDWEETSREFTLDHSGKLALACWLRHKCRRPVQRADHGCYDHSAPGGRLQSVHSERCSLSASRWPGAIGSPLPSVGSPDDQHRSGDYR